VGQGGPFSVKESHAAPFSSFEMPLLPAPVDVAQLSLLGDADFVQEIVDLFITTSTRYLDELQQAVTSRDAVALARVAHALKGACLAMFASGMASLATSLEIAGRSGALEPAPALLSELRRSFVQTADQLRGVRPG
jgi:HPt (histidine-containing phosphotransfer) domain-containing protein